MLRRLSLTCAALALGCRGEPDLVYSELPASGYLGVVYLDDGARVVAASGLSRVGSPLELEIDAPSAGARRVLLVGYEEAVVRGFTELGPEALAAVPLRRADATTAALPPPAWWASGALEVDPVRLETAPTTEELPVALGASWVPLCDRTLERLDRTSLRLSCGTEYCDGEVGQFGCDLVIRTNRCAASVITAPIRSTPGLLGRPEVEGVLGTCEAPEPRPDALYSLDCGGTARCLVDVLPRDSSIHPALRVAESAPLLAIEPLDSKPERLEIYGYLTGLAHAGEHILVSSFDGGVGSRRCLEPAPTRLFVLRDDTLETVATSTAPACLTTIVGDPVSGGFIGVHGRPAEAIVRIDASGRIVASRPVPPEVRVSLAATAAVFDARPEGRGQPTVVAVTFGRAPRARDRGYLVVFDSETLEVRYVGTTQAEQEDRSPDYVSVMLGAQPDEYVVLDRSHRNVWSFLPNSQGEPNIYPLAICRGVQEPMELAPSRDGTVVFRSFDGEGRGTLGVFGLRDDSLCQRLGFFEYPAEPTAVIGWQGSKQLYLAGLRRTDPEDRARAELAFFDADLPGYRPGTLPVGRGDVGPFVAGREGTLFATLPWTAQVLRVEPER